MTNFLLLFYQQVVFVFLHGYFSGDLQYQEGVFGGGKDLCSI